MAGFLPANLQQVSSVQSYRSASPRGVSRVRCLAQAQADSLVRSLRRCTPVGPLGRVSHVTTAPGVIELEAVEVMALKRVQSIQAVPIVITAYSGAFFDAAGIDRYKDLAPLVPGVFIQEQSPNNPGIKIRGVTTDSGDPRLETRVSIFQDGVSISRSCGSVSELFYLERVELPKGPQGTLFGRGTEVGAISIIQRKLTAATDSRFRAGFGNFWRPLQDSVLNPSQAPLYGASTALRF